MRALVTGADGFIGSHLAELLHGSGYDVRALALYNSFNSWGWLENVECRDDIEIIAGDVRDPSSCMATTKGVDIVFHLAALVAIPYSYLAIDSYVDTNVRGTLNICRAALENGVSRVVHVSTSEVYGTALYVPIDEAHPLQPQSPYSATKVGADAIALSFHRSFELPISIARPFNTYGPRQSARAVIPTIITQLASGVEKVALGDLRPKRDFNYVEDTCAGLLAVGTHPDTVGEVLNIGSGTDMSIAELFELICTIMDSAATYGLDETRTRPEESEVFRLQCDCSKLQTMTGFTPEIPLEEGLRRTVEWFTAPENLAKYHSHVYNI